MAGLEPASPFQEVNWICNPAHNQFCHMCILYLERIEGVEPYAFRIGVEAQQPHHVAHYPHIFLNSSSNPSFWNIFNMKHF